MFVRRLLALIVVSVSVVACGGGDDATNPERPSVVVTTPILGAIVTAVVGDAATVDVIMPNGVDPHAWEPSAKDIERVQSADFLVVNGLHLEASLDEAIDAARADGTVVFEATRHIDVIAVDGDEEHPDGDPHFWTDAAAMADVAVALGDALADVGIDVGDRASVEYEELLTLDNELRDESATLDEQSRRLVTGHESLAYLARAYGFEIVGTVVPGLTSNAEVSAGELADLKAVIDEQGVGVIFTESGTPSQVVDAIADEVGVEVVELDTHLLPEDGSYVTFMRNLVSAIVTALSS